MNSTVRFLVSGAVVLLAAAGGGAIHAVPAGSAPVVDAAPAVPVAVANPVLQLPGSSAAADAVVTARGAVDDVVAAQIAAAAEPEYTCEPAADARVVGGIIVNKDCPAINAAREAAHRAFVEQNWVDGECIGYGCSPEQDAEINVGEAAAQDEYWVRCAGTPPDVDGC